MLTAEMAFLCGASGRHKLTGTEKAKGSGKEAGKSVWGRLMRCDVSILTQEWESSTQTCVFRTHQRICLFPQMIISCGSVMCRVRWQIFIGI